MPIFSSFPYLRSHYLVFVIFIKHFISLAVLIFIFTFSIFRISKDAISYFTEIDKSFKLTVIDGAYHEIHNEIEKYRKPYFDYLKNIMNELLFSN